MIRIKIVIIGEGKIGSALAQQLSQENHDVTIIDNDPDIVEHAVDTLDILGIVGNGASYTVQTEAGVAKADLLIAATSSDELNILSCLVAKKIGAEHTIARVRNPEYSNQLSFFKRELGLSMIVNPEYESAVEMFRILRFPSAIKLDVFAKGKVEMAEISLPQNNILDGMQIKSLASAFKSRVLVCAVSRGDELFIPDGNFTLKSGDKIHITASHTAIADFLKETGIYKEGIKSVMIVGGGKVGFYLAHLLAETNIKVKIIELDEKKCTELSEDLPKCTIVCGDGTDQTVLREEGIDGCDALISLTGIDEENIILSMYASQINVKKVISKINNTNLIGMLGAIGLDSVISPKKITADRIVRYVRAMHNSEGTTFNTLYRIINDKAEALEFTISDDSLPFLNVPLKELHFVKNVLIACIIKNGRIIYPGGNDVIENGDSLIIVAPTDKYIKELNDIFQ